MSLKPTIRLNAMRTMRGKLSAKSRHGMARLLRAEGWREGHQGAGLSRCPKSEHGEALLGILVILFLTALLIYIGARACSSVLVSQAVRDELARERARHEMEQDRRTRQALNDTLRALGFAVAAGILAVSLGFGLFHALAGYAARRRAEAEALRAKTVNIAVTEDEHGRIASLVTSGTPPEDVIPLIRPTLAPQSASLPDAEKLRAMLLLLPPQERRQILGMLEEEHEDASSSG